MPQSMQGIIIALLISLLVGIIIGFYLRQGRVNALTEALQKEQKRQEDLEKEHEARLRAATAQLQQDYEDHLAEKIERYQSQYEEQLQQLEAEYQARQGLALEGSGMAPGFDPPSPETLEDEGIEGGPVSDVEQRIRKQYETRLKEAAYKIQQAYEHHLREKLAEAREANQREFDQRLAEAIEHYQDESEARLAEALRDRELQEAALGSQTGNLGGSGTSTEISVTDETLLQERLAALEVELRTTYDRRLAERIEQYQDEMTQRTAQLEEEFAARLQMAQAMQPATEPPNPGMVAGASTAELEARLTAEYDQRLAEAIARHQDELTDRTEALEAEFADRLAMVQGESANSEGFSGLPEPELEARLRNELEASLRAEYEQQLAEKLEQYQAELNQRMRELEAGLEAQLDMGSPALDLLTSGASSPLSFDPLEDRAVAAESLEDESVELEPFMDLDEPPAFDQGIIAEDESLEPDPFMGLDEIPTVEQGVIADEDSFNLDALDLSDVTFADDDSALAEAATFDLNGLDLSEANFLPEADFPDDSPAPTEGDAFSLGLSTDAAALDLDVLDDLINRSDPETSDDPDLEGSA